MAVLGQITVNEISIFEVDAAPDTGSGIDAPIGSIAIMTDGSGIYQKISASNTGWGLVSIALPIPSDQVSFTTLVAFFGAANNVKDALDVLGLNKANLYNGNIFTGPQEFQHPNSTSASFDIRPGYFSPTPSGLFLRVPRNNGPFILGYLDPSNNVVPILGRAVNANQVISGTLADDHLLLSSSRVILGNTSAPRHVQINSNGLGIGFLTNDQASAALVEMRSNNQGFLMPRLSESEIANITSPEQYLTLFNTTRNSLAHFISGVWTFEQYSYITGTTSNSTTTYLNVSHTSISSLPTGTYYIEGVLRYNSAATATGIGVRLGPAGYNSMLILWEFSANPNGASNQIWFRTQLDPADSFVAPSSTATTNNIALFRGTFRLTSSISPVLQMRSEVSGSAVTITDGFFRIKKIG